MTDDKTSASTSPRSHIFIPALIGLIGVAVGSALTAFTSYLNQQATIDQQRLQLNAVHARDELSQLRTMCVRYLEAAIVLVDSFDHEPNPEELRQHYEQLNRSAYVILLYAEHDLASASMQFSNAIRVAVFEPDRADRKKVVEGLAAWVMAARNEIGQYRNQVMPDKWRRDLLNDMLRHGFGDGYPAITR